MSRIYHGVPNAAPLRVAVDARVLDDRYHGIGRVTEALVRELAAWDELAITLFVRREQRAKRFDAQELARQLNLDIAFLDHELADKRQFFSWPGALKAVNADVGFFPYNLGAPLFGHTPSVTVVHDCIIEESAAYAPTRTTRFLYRVGTSLALRHNVVITPSRASAAALQRHYRLRVPDDHVVRWGVDPAFAQVPPAAGNQVQGSTLPKTFFLHVGARRPHKNIPVLVKALAHRPVHEHLVLVGSIDRRFVDDVGVAVSAAGVQRRVHHYENVSDTELALLYSAATAFLYPSFVEGVGLPLLEAMVAGLPVVASDIPVFHEFGGEAAHFVAADDPAQWARAMAELAQAKGLRETLVERGHHQVSDNSWRVSAARLLPVLQAAAAARPAKSPQGGARTDSAT